MWGLFQEFSRKNKARLNPPSKHVIAVFGRQSPNMTMETGPMNLLMLGYLAALAPSLVALAWLAWRVPTFK